VPELALTRHVPSSFAHALAAAVPDAPIDVAQARAQHAGYRAALASLGLEVRVLDADDAHPDCCFVEDTAVVAAGVALVTHPGAPSRRGEVGPVAAALAELGVTIARVEAPATLDGGDCMRVGSTLYVGRSARTNAAGIARLAEVFEPRGLRVVAIELPPGVLHLKCACAPLGDDAITHAVPLPREPFRGLSLVAIPEVESYAANVLAIGRRVIVPAGFARTADLLARAGYEPVPLATTELRKADGALTCLSIII
jgi:dimethylargininase